MTLNRSNAATSASDGDPAAGACRLCGTAGPLRESHILSKFVFRWFRRTMPSPQPTFPMYDVVTDELTAMQDGIKRPFLCGACEQRIGNWERNFKERFFDPFNARRGEAREYQDWLPRFCVSIVWRVLQHYVEQPAIKNLPPEFRRNVDRALRTWRAFLLEQARSPRPHDVHILPISADVGSRDYVERTIEMMLARNGRTDEQYVFVKLGGLLLIGVVNDPRSRQWRHTRVDASKGVWGAQGEFAMPATVHDWMNRRAPHTAEIKAKWPAGPPKSWRPERRPRKG